MRISTFQQPSQGLGRALLASAVAVLLSWTFVGVVHAQESASPEEMPGRVAPAQEEIAPAPAAAPVRLANLDRATRVVLESLRPAERSEVAALLAESSTGFLKAERIGIHRGNGTGQPMRALTPDWQSVAGGRAAALVIRSPEAAAIRVAILFGHLPEGAEVTFFSPERPAERYGPYAPAALQAGVDDDGSVLPFWSPVVAGDAVAMEVFLPAAAASQDPQVELVEVGHLFRSPFRVETAAVSGSCNVDIGCAPEWETLARSVARIVIQGRSLCSGQLLATDNDDAGRVFLTAAHCVAGRPAASSLSFLWFFRRARCNAGDETMTQTAGGADLLAKTGVVGDRNAATDHTLVRLRRDAPDGVTLAGWSAKRSRRSNRQWVTSVHHPSGDDKKISTGRVRGRFNLFGPPSRSRPQTHHRTFWRTGTTEGGSSGSGLYVGDEWPEQYLIGVLSGGFASCQAQDEPDFYGAFHRAFRKLKRFLQ